MDKKDRTRAELGAQLARQILDESGYGYENEDITRLLATIALLMMADLPDEK